MKSLDWKIRRGSHSGALAQALAGGEAGQPVVVLDHPGLGGVTEEAGGEAPRGVAVSGEGDDEVARLEDRPGLPLRRRGAGAERERGRGHQEGTETPAAAHLSRSTSYTSTSSSLPLTFTTPSGRASTYSFTSR